MPRFLPCFLGLHIVGCYVRVSCVTKFVYMVRVTNNYLTVHKIIKYKNYFRSKLLYLDEISKNIDLGLGVVAINSNQVIRLENLLNPLAMKRRRERRESKEKWVHSTSSSTVQVINCYCFVYLFEKIYYSSFMK